VLERNIKIRNDFAGLSHCLEKSRGDAVGVGIEEPYPNDSVQAVEGLKKSYEIIRFSAIATESSCVLSDEIDLFYSLNCKVPRLFQDIFQ
jgi:hypothetical protein